MELGGWLVASELELELSSDLGLGPETQRRSLPVRFDRGQRVLGVGRT